MELKSKLYLSRKKFKKNPNQFSPGNTPWNKNSTETKHVEQPEKQLQHPVQAEPELQIIRPTQELLDAAVDCFESSSSCSPHLLRPVLVGKSEREQRNDDHLSDYEDENIIVHFQKLTELLQVFTSQHNSDRCRDPIPRVTLVKRQGLCNTVLIMCEKCRFMSQDFKLFREIQRRGRGPAAGDLNEALPISVLKTKIGAADIRFLLATLNIKPPSFQMIQSKVNSASKQIVNLNEQSMKDNQEFVLQVNKLKGLSNEVHVETDASYNNRPCCGYEAGTQSFAPMIESNTQRKLVISLQSTNKLCSGVKGCTHSDPQKCGKNYATDSTICSAEMKMSVDNFIQIEHDNVLKVTNVTSDACGQLGRATEAMSMLSKRKVTQNLCTVHRLRSLQKAVKNMKLNTKMPHRDIDVFKLKLSVLLRKRITLELSRIRKAGVEFVSNARKAIDNVLICIAGNHEKCQLVSHVCCAHIATYSKKYLPYGQYIKLIPQDMQSLRKTMSRYLDNTNLTKMKFLYNTNKSESMHHRLFTIAPKNTTWRRNFAALCHSAAHSSTHGTGKSAKILGEKIGVKMNNSHFQKVDAKASYDRKRQMTLYYKTKRYIAKKYKYNRKVRLESLHGHCSPQVANEHSYALNPE